MEKMRVIAFLFIGLIYYSILSPVLIENSDFSKLAKVHYLCNLLVFIYVFPLYRQQIRI